MTNKDDKVAAIQARMAAIDQRKKARELKRKRDLEAYEKMGSAGKTIINVASLCVLALPVACTVIAVKNVHRDHLKEAANPRETKVGERCGGAGRGTSVDFAVKEDAVLLAKADSGAEPVLWVTPYSSIPAPIEVGMTVHEQCRDGDWSQVRILSGMDGLQMKRGWVQTSKLRPVQTSAAGRRVYEAGDLANVGVVPPKDRQLVVAVLNQIMASRPECLAIDLKGVEKKSSEYVAPCFTEDDPVYDHFRLSDVKDAGASTPVEPLNQYDAGLVCERAAKARMTHPSTFEGGLTTGYSRGLFGESVVSIKFKARNSFNMKLEFNATCALKGSEVKAINVSEATE